VESTNFTSSFRTALEISHLERIRLARIGTLHIHDLDHFLAAALDESFPAWVSRFMTAYFAATNFSAAINFCLQQSSPPVNSTAEPQLASPAFLRGVRQFIHASKTSSTLIFFPPWNAYAVSHQVQRRLQPVRRTENARQARRVPSP